MGYKFGQKRKSTYCSLYSQIKFYMRKQLAILFRKLLTLISPKLNTEFIYYRCFGKQINLKHPQTLNEKVMWLKLHNYNKNALVAQCADKYLVRNYVTQCGCKDILIPLCGVYDKFEDIAIDNLPQQFVIKSTYGSGMYIIVEDKNKADWSEMRKQTRQWAKSTFHLINSELQYSTPRRIIIEHFIPSSSGKQPDDYKIYCINGTPGACMVCIGREKGQHPKFYIMDKQANLLRDWSYDGLNAPVDFVFQKPDGWDDMYKYAAMLSKPFPLVRCDFYLSKGKVYFGELTFTSSAGLDTDFTENGVFEITKNLAL